MTLVNTTLLSAFRVLRGQCLASKTLVMIPKGDPRTPMVTSRLSVGPLFTSVFARTHLDRVARCHWQHKGS